VLTHSYDVCDLSSSCYLLLGFIVGAILSSLKIFPLSLLGKFCIGSFVSELVLFLFFFMQGYYSLGPGL
jgi:hypothetical protein